MKPFSQDKELATMAPDHSDLCATICQPTESSFGGRVRADWTRKLANNVALVLLLCCCSMASAAPAHDPGDGIDDAAVIEEVRHLAERGDPEAQLHLGIMYSQGAGVPQNDAEAVKWLRLSAEQGFAGAQYNYGYMHALGKGVPQDDNAAVVWFRLAAKQGNSAAQHNLGFSYLLGKGVNEDAVAAARWFHLAAEQDFAASQHNLFRMYADDKGIPQDDAEAIKWLTLAAEQGSVEAQYDLGNVHGAGSNGVRKNYVVAYAWCGVASAAGHEPATICYLGAEHYLSDSEKQRARELTTDFRSKYSARSVDDTRLFADPRKFIERRKQTTAPPRPY
jgi:TPR repeat protein